MFIDAHCDVLTKLYLHPDMNFTDGIHLDVTLNRLQEARALLQCFSIYMTDSIKRPSMKHIQEYINLFHTKIAVHPEIQIIRTSVDLQHAFHSGRIGAMLSLEGTDALQGDIDAVDYLFAQGVRSLQITWNYANWAADGVHEPRHAGLSLRGRKLVEACANTGMILDMSHLNEPGFWEAAELYGRAFIASHANAAAVCPHPRNLNDEQIKAVAQTKGCIGLALFPPFVRKEGAAVMADLLPHIDHICALGGEEAIMLGADFDGIDQWVEGLEHPGKLGDFASLLNRYYSNNVVEGILWRNAYRFFCEHLPEFSETQPFST